MEELITYRVDLLDAMESAVREITTAIANLAAENLHYPVQAGSGTPHYIIFHLRELEKQVFRLQLPRFIAEENLVLAVFDDQAWMREYYHADEPASAILDELAKLRHQELNWLRTLSPTQWSCTARHPWWGVHTVQWWAELQLDITFQHLKKLVIS